jgi:hypothetical protein
MRMVEGVNSRMIYLIHCKNFYKCHNVLQPSTKKSKKIAVNFIHVYIKTYFN